MDIEQEKYINRYEECRELGPLICPKCGILMGNARNGNNSGMHETTDYYFCYSARHDTHDYYEVHMIGC